MDLEQLQNDIKEIMNTENKWYYTVVGEVLKIEEKEIAKARLNSLINTYMRELNKNEWDKKSEEEQSSSMKNVIDAILIDAVKYGVPDWDKIIEDMELEV